MVVALVGYALPWTLTPGAATRFNGYDLAEWMSLHPASGGETPMLLTSLLLRVPLALLGVAAASNGAQRAAFAHRVTWMLIALALAVALVPPLEILDDPNNPNYRQQLMIAVGTLIAGLVVWLPPLRRRWLTASLAAAAGASGVWGAVRAYDLLGVFALPLSPGVGAVVFAAACLALAGALQTGNKTR
jgi:hypothetical protein